MEQTIYPDYFPKPELRKNHYVDSHINVLCQADCVHGMTWRPRFAYTIVVGRRQYSNSGVGHDTIYATPDEAIAQAHRMAIESLKVLFTWSDRSLDGIRAELVPFANTCRRLKIDLRNSKIWES